MGELSFEQFLQDKCAELLSHYALLGDQNWSRLVHHLRRAGLSDKVTFVPFARFPFHREPLFLGREVMLGDQKARIAAAGVIAENLGLLLNRDSSLATTLILVNYLSPQLLARALDELMVSELTAHRLAGLVIADAIAPAVEAAFAGLVPGRH